MKANERLIGFHNVLRHKRYKDDLFDMDKRYWHKTKRPAKANQILEVHMRRVAGNGSPQECDDVIATLTKR